MIKIQEALRIGTSTNRETLKPLIPKEKLLHIRDYDLRTTETETVLQWKGKDKDPSDRRPAQGKQRMPEKRKHRLSGSGGSQQQK